LKGEDVIFAKTTSEDFLGSVAFKSPSYDFGNHESQFSVKFKTEVAFEEEVLFEDNVKF
jgi:hypothetical protein